jgi:hypothetical protein
MEEMNAEEKSKEESELEESLKVARKNKQINRNNKVDLAALNAQLQI